MRPTRAHAPTHPRQPTVRNGARASPYRRVPSSRESGRGVPRSWKLVVEESGDGGRTWTKHGPLRFDGNAIQPAMWIGRDGKVRMLARSASDYDAKTGKRADPVGEGFRARNGGRVERGARAPSHEEDEKAPGPYCVFLALFCL